MSLIGNEECAEKLVYSEQKLVDKKVAKHEVNVTDGFNMCIDY